ncbi:flagellar transcriptional activator FlhD [Azospirillum brasilense]|uniref:Flagellar transcriptional activator FlhD n=1 Tax=Azospirillum brasilense TaxID=192 RepID=A0A560BTK0_AZOBR|nr:flagellar transcriptional regulator FlhD [Azospirillum brasilense]TWA75936.1 flagellar transcriptional activator FlhD [Azospirillum brasilense]
MAIDFQQDIYELNLHYLMVLQRVAHNDVAEAAMRFGIDAKTAEAVCDASIRELQTVASGVVAMISARPLLQELTSRNPVDRADRLRAGAILRSISTPDR